MASPIPHSLPPRSEYLAGPDTMVFSLSTNKTPQFENAGTNPNGFFLNIQACGNNMTGDCDKKGVLFCNGCKTAKYCSIECHIKHWAMHKETCLSARFVKKKLCPPTEWSTYEGNRPLVHVTLTDEKKFDIRPATEDEACEYHSYMRKYGPDTTTLSDGAEDMKFLWGRSPPLDILNLPANEGVCYNKPLLLNFRGVDDLRHVMKTIGSVPEDYTGSICSHLYDVDFDLQIRNISILLLAMQYPSGDAAELITHLWYSASIPFEMYSLLEEIIEIFKDIKESLTDSPLTHTKVTIVAESSSIELILSKPEFILLYSKLEFGRSGAYEYLDTRRLAYVHPGNPVLKYKIRGHLCDMPPHLRTTEQAYRQSGVLLPINYNISRGRHPNPTFYDFANNPLVHPLASPLDNHDLPELRDYCRRNGLPPNDFHGAAFFKTREMVASFCSRVAKVGAKFVVSTDPTHHSARMIGTSPESNPDDDLDNDLDNDPGNNAGNDAADQVTWETSSEATTMTLGLGGGLVQVNTSEEPEFDRILVSSFMGDIESSNQEAIFDLAPLLKTYEQNPHATILSLLPWARDRGFIDIPARIKYSLYLTRLLPFKWHVYTGRAHAKALKEDLTSVHEMREAELRLMEKQDKRCFRKYIVSWKVRELAAVVGLKLMEENQMTIAPAWPYRLKMTGTKKEQEEKFSLRFTSLMKGNERLVEFKPIPRCDPKVLPEEDIAGFRQELILMDFAALSVKKQIEHIDRQVMMGVWD